jgi:teichuronic acid biosynthesis glycosyltransferase TuaG
LVLSSFNLRTQKFLKQLRYSVVVPCYNGGEKVRRAIDSCFAQTLRPYEVIVVDDHSSEETVTILKKLVEKYGGLGFRCHFLEKNGGVSNARNLGIAAATGDYICFLDADDAWHPQKLFFADHIIGHGGCEVLGHGFTHDPAFADAAFDVAYAPLKKFGFFSVLMRNPLTTPSLVVARSLNMQFDERMQYAEDHDLILRLSLRNTITFIDYPLVFIDRAIGSPGGLSGNRWKMRKGEMRMYINLCAHHPVLYLVLPFLLIFSLAKHLLKIITKFNQ